MIPTCPPSCRLCINILSFEITTDQLRDGAATPIKGAMTHDVFRITSLSGEVDPHKVLVRIHGQGVKVFFDRGNHGGGKARANGRPYSPRPRARLPSSAKTSTNSIVALSPFLLQLLRYATRLFDEMTSERCDLDKFCSAECFINCDIQLSLLNFIHRCLLKN